MKTHKKQGLDDFLIANGVDALKKLDSNTEEWIVSRVLHELNTEFVYVRNISMIAQLPTSVCPEVRFYKPSVWAKELIGNRMMRVGPSTNGSTLSEEEDGDE